MAHMQNELVFYRITSLILVHSKPRARYSWFPSQGDCWVSADLVKKCIMSAVCLKGSVYICSTESSRNRGSTAHFALAIAWGFPEGVNPAMKAVQWKIFGGGEKKIWYPYLKIQNTTRFLNLYAAKLGCNWGHLCRGTVITISIPRERHPQARLIKSATYQHGTTSAGLSPKGHFHYVTKVKR